jgi:hypothetical protein
MSTRTIEGIPQRNVSVVRRVPAAYSVGWAMAFLVGDVALLVEVAA